MPFFTKNLTEIKGLSTINARADKVLASAIWQEPMKKRHCLIPASAIYECRKWASPKAAVRLELTSGNPLAIAGLWDAWKDGQGPWLQSFAMVTTEANELMAAAARSAAAYKGDEMERREVIH